MSLLTTSSRTVWKRFPSSSGVLSRWTTRTSSKIIANNETPTLEVLRQRCTVMTMCNSSSSNSSILPNGMSMGVQTSSSSCQQLQKHQSVSSSSSVSPTELPHRRRRRRPGVLLQTTDDGRSPSQQQQRLYEPPKKEDGSDQSLVEHVQDPNVLSPWVPCPDIVIRRVLEVAQVRWDDVHVDLGSGDGRVNLMAAPLVSRSIGLEVDKLLLDRARTSALRKGLIVMNDDDDDSRVQFHQVNLLDFEKVKQHLKDATVITAYLVEDGLRQIIPLLDKVWEETNPHCRIVTVGYQIPGWKNPEWVELSYGGLQISLYKQTEVDKNVTVPPIIMSNLDTEEEEDSMAMPVSDNHDDDDNNNNNFSFMSPAEAAHRRQQQQQEELATPENDESEMIDNGWDDFDESDAANFEIDEHGKPIPKTQD